MDSDTDSTDQILDRSESAGEVAVHGGRVVDERMMDGIVVSRGIVVSTSTAAASGSK